MYFCGYYEITPGERFLLAASNIFLSLRCYECIALFFQEVGLLKQLEKLIFVFQLPNMEYHVIMSCKSAEECLENVMPEFVKPLGKNAVSMSTSVL